jgi:hypothetical protein
VGDAAETVHGLNVETVFEPFQTVLEPLPAAQHDRGPVFLAASDVEGERDGGQPFPGYRRVACAAGEQASAWSGFEASHGRADPRGHLGWRRVEGDAGGELPPGARVLLQCRHRVEVVGWLELAGDLLDRADAINPVGPDRVCVMGVAGQVPASVPDDDGPGVCLGFPFAAGLAAVPGRPASRRIAMERRAARSVTPSGPARSPAVVPGRVWRISRVRRARGAGLGSAGTRAGQVSVS